MAVFERGSPLPRPVKFRLVEGGEKRTVDVFQIMGGEYIGTQKYVYDCNSLSSKGNVINYKLSYFRREGRWLIEVG